jgi:MFS family permease
MAALSRSILPQRLSGADHAPMLAPASSRLRPVAPIEMARASLNFGPLLAVAAPAALLAVVLAGISRTLVNTDTWIALVSGREIARHGLPSADHLTALAQGHTWVDQQWLGQLILYAADRVGGVGLTVAVCLASVVAGFALAALAAHRRGASPLVLLAFFVAAFLAGPWVVQARTQALAVALFSLILWLLSRDRDAQRASTLWVLLILCVWANVHGSVVVGAALVSAYGLQALVRIGWRWRSAAFLLLAPVALFASPYASGLPGYYRLMLFDPPFGREIVEWQRTTPSRQTAVFFALVVAVGVLAVIRRKRVRMLDWLLLGITLAVALSAIRGTPWFALAALAVVPPLATRSPGATSFWGPVAAALAVVAIAGTIAAAGWAATRPYETASQARGLAVVREQTRGGSLVLANLEFADWLLWKIPELRGRIAYDGRTELLTRRQWDGVVSFARLEPGWRSAVRGYSLIVTNRAEAVRLIRTGQWRRVYADAKFAVVRSTRSS